MAGLLGGIQNLLGINTEAGNSQLQQALAALQAVNAPSIQQLTLPQLQQYVSAGQLSPQQYQAILMNPQVYSQVIQNTQDNTGTNAQKAALQQLSGIAQNGSTPIMQAQLLNALQNTNQANQASRGAIDQNAQERGIGGSGLSLVQKLMAEQNNAQNANLSAVNAGANNAQLALNAIAQQGQLGQSLQGQQNQSSQAQAEAARQIAEYNSQLQSAANQYNTQNANQAQQMNLANAQDISNQNVGNANMRTQYNAQLPQQVFQDQMQKAQGIAGNYGQQSQLDQQHAGMQNAFLGNLIGAGATVAGGMYGGPAGAAAGKGMTSGMDTSSPAYNRNAAKNNPYNQYAMGGEVKQCYAEGGEVHDHQLCMKAGGHVPGQAMKPGDNPANDTVDAKLSPGEIVLPRSVAQTPDAPQKAAQFVQQTKGMPGMQPTVNSFAEALKIMEANGLEVRLCPKGA